MYDIRIQNRIEIIHFFGATTKPTVYIYICTAYSEYLHIQLQRSNSSIFRSRVPLHLCTEEHIIVSSDMFLVLYHFHCRVQICLPNCSSALL